MSKCSNWKCACGVAVLVLLCPVAIGAGVQRTDVVETDDWPADSLLDPGTIKCPGGELVWTDPVTPVCLGSGRIHFRGVVGYGCIEGFSNGDPEPRLTGVVMFEANGNLDADYTGPVWGTYKNVPAESCDPEDLVDPPVYWKGVWQGYRYKICNGGPCYWLGEFKLVGKGHGGSLEGLHFKGTETIVTFTPLPVPWELIGVCGPDPSVPCGPEGFITGTIKE